MISQRIHLAFEVSGDLDPLGYGCLVLQISSKQTGSHFCPRPSSAESTDGGQRPRTPAAKCTTPATSQTEQMNEQTNKQPSRDDLNPKPKPPKLHQKPPKCCVWESQPKPDVGLEQFGFWVVNGPHTV